MAKRQRLPHNGALLPERSLLHLIRKHRHRKQLHKEKDKENPYFHRQTHGFRGFVEFFSPMNHAGSKMITKLTFYDT